MKNVSPINENLDIPTRKFVLDNAGGTVTSVNNQNPTSGNVTLSATNIPISDPNQNFTTDTVQGAINELFQSASSGKTAIANAIGTPTTSNNTFGEMATAINNAKTTLDTFIDSAEGTTTGSESLSQLTAKLSDVRVFKQNTKLRQQASTTHTITLNKSVPANRLCFTVNRLINDNATVEFSANFNNGDESNFIYNSDRIEFVGGVARIKHTTVQNNTPTITSVSTGTIYSWTFSLDVFFGGFRINSVSGNVLTYEYFYEVNFIEASSFIDVSDVSSLESIVFNRNQTGNASVFLSIIVEGDTDMKMWDGSSWVYIGQPNWGMSKATVESLTYLQFEQLLGTATKLKFFYVLTKTSFSEISEIDSIQLNGRAIGNFIPVPASGNQPYTMSYNESTKQITFTFIQSDTYQVNWIDT